MKNRFIVIYTVFAAAVFIFSITFFGYNLFNEYNTNQKKSELMPRMKILPHIRRE